MVQQKAVILLGAGASIEYGAPTTQGLTDKIEAEVAIDELTKATGADEVFRQIKRTLGAYLIGQPNS